ncbi:MAG: formate dehydrogenase accessory sulfurtransferase FdhD [Clostridia bacterium]|nr:formate dehydrogenase accessory sulfurtransferase FdhD [Clostridia bacterium]MDH7572451.1 formate dehydrogenase accessory sulfurtransferase FdhD [Clostridia bacterium]
MNRETIGLSDMRGLEEVTCARFSEEGWVTGSVHVPYEMELTLYVNQQELVTVLCTPTKLNCLVLGFLYNEGIISGIEDVATMRVCEDESLADVRLKNPEQKLPTRRTLSTGCGGGAVFKTPGQEVDSELVVSPTEVLLLMREFLKQMELYRAGGGVHTSALADGKSLLVVAEDIGRHNTLDRIQGECMLRGLSTADRLLLTTGRISSEMVLKAAKMRVPVVVSLRTPTGRAVSLAWGLGIALVGRTRGKRLSAYSHPERLGCPIAGEQACIP